MHEQLDKTRRGGGKKGRKEPGVLRCGTWNVNGWVQGKRRQEMRDWLMRKEKMDLVAIQEATRGFQRSIGDGDEDETWKRWSDEGGI